MYIIKVGEAQRKYLNELAGAFPEQFKPEPDDYTRKMLITISQAEASLIVEVVSSSPRLPVEVILGGNVRIDGNEVESGEQKLLVHSIISDLIAAIDVISPRDKEVIGFHFTHQ
ncbi:MAG: hypothetical protein HKP41_14490 [Desulfobacterales bacterium]|nr:hypothetical protein [Deltaproteobacteria bacterium]NNK95556.1 hypothetical protein [Desulfobacterales bacterium]